LTWTTFLLAQHPAIMRELMDELDRVLGGSAPTRDQVPQLSFLDRVIKESMRILPPVPFTIRAAEDDAIPMGSLTLSHGTRVICITMNARYGMPMLLTKNDRRYESSKVQGQIHEMVKLPLK